MQVVCHDGRFNFPQFPRQFWNIRHKTENAKAQTMPFATALMNTKLNGARGGKLERRKVGRGTWGMPRI